ncbi:MAG: hypothetical protein ABGF52_11380 [Candidatus Asgardarchaeum sp.]
MFFIVNKTKQHITLGDIALSLGPRQAIDLDRIMPRAKSEASKHLLMAKKKGDIEIRVKDALNVPVRTEKDPKSSDLDKMKQDIIGEMKDTMKEILDKQPKGGMSSQDLTQMTQTLLEAMPANKETIIIKEGGQSERQDEEVEMDEEMLAEINARAVDEIVEGTEVKSVHYKEEKQKNTILSNADELEDLLG